MSPRVQFSLTVIVAVGVAAYLASDVWRVPLTISLPTAALLIGAPAAAVWRWSSRRPSRHAAAQAVSIIRELPIAEARARALKALENSSRFECVRAALAAPLPAGLPASVGELLSVYASIRSAAGEAHVSREQIGPSDYRPGLIRIGSDLDSVELVVRPGEDRVYEIDGSDADAQEIGGGGIPSLYHWILISEEILYG